MFRCAFIMNSERMTPETYSLRFQSEEFFCYVAAVNGLEMAQELAKQLAEDGVTAIDLCGDYTAEMAQTVAAYAGGSVRVCFAKYQPEEAKKLDALTSLNPFGIIMKGAGLGDGCEKRELTSDEFDTVIYIAGSDEAAAQAAKDLVAQGIAFIELCSYFDAEKAAAISTAIEGKVPVGYCG